MTQVQSTEPVVEQFVPIDGEVAKVEGRTPWQLFWGRFRHDKIAMLALIWVILLVVSAFLAPLFVRLVAHNGPNDIHPELSNEFNIPVIGPNATLLGRCGRAGARCLVSNAPWSAHLPIQVALLATGISVVIGLVLGLPRRLLGGKTDTFTHG